MPCSNKDEGQKFDSGKLRYDLVDPLALRAMVEVFTYGAAKYAPENWRKVPDARARYYAAALRHVEAWRDGEELDPESGLPHLAHAACCIHFLTALFPGTFETVVEHTIEDGRTVWRVVEPEKEENKEATMNTLPLAMRLRTARKARGMTIREAADAIGISRSYYHSVEIGTKAPKDEKPFENFMAIIGERMS